MLPLSFSLQRQLPKWTSYFSFFLFFIFLAIAGKTQTPDINGILYVKKGGAGSGSGNSWANAAAEFATALRAADSLNDEYPGMVKEIWVTGGTYMPMFSAGYESGTPNPRNRSFLLAANVKIYGGFAGTETSLAARNLFNTANQSILSGDLGVLNNNTDNAYHVVVQTIYNGTGLLDGFTVTGGNASGGGSLEIKGRSVNASYGGGLYIITGVNLSNITVSANQASASGGGIFVDEAICTFANLTVSGNTAAANGGGMYCSAATMVLNNIVAGGNKATSGGGGIYTFSSSFQLTGATIGGNSASSGGGIYHNDGALWANSYVRNAVIYGNSSGIVNGPYQQPEISYSLIQGVSANPTNHNISGSTDPLFVYSPSHTTAPFVTADYRLAYNSAAINAGSNILYPGLNASTLDRAGYPRVYNYSGGGIIDMGAYEFQDTAQCITTVNITKTYGHPDFEPGLTIDSGRVVSYTSADTTIASVFQDIADSNKWKIRIKKAGSVDIMALNAGDSCGNKPGNVLIKLAINKALLTVTANNDSKAYDLVRYRGGAGVTYTGFAYNDSATSLGGTLAYSGTAQSRRQPGTYTIIPAGLTSDNYNFSYVNGTLTIYITQTPDSNGVLYVKKGATGSGSSWSDALGEAADGFKFAQMLNAVSEGKVKQLWIAGGIYKPLYSSTDVDSMNVNNRENSFLLVKDVEVYGGFAGTEAGIANRNLSDSSYKAVLSGDLGVQNNNSDNAYRVVMDGNYYFPTGIAMLNDLTITGANASRDFLSYGFGGGIANYSSEIRLTNVILSGNVAQQGGAIFSNGSLKLKNVLISGNTGMLLAGGIYNTGSDSISLINVTIAGNYGDSEGGAIYDDSGAPITIRNSIIYGNSSGVRASFQRDHSLIQGMNADTTYHNPAGTVNPLFVNAPSYLTAPFTTGDYHTQAGSPVIDNGSNSLFAGLDANSQDLAGAPRVYNYASGGIIDMGAYEHQQQEQAQAQTITADTLSKVYGAIDFEPVASASSGLPINYTSADTTIATVYQDITDSNKWKIHIKKAGIVSIKLNQPGNENYQPATEVIREFTISKASLIITADDKRRCNGKTNPEFTCQYSGFVKEETVAALDTLPVLSSSATNASAAGTYPIIPSDASAANYAITYNNGSLMVDSLPVSTVSTEAGSVLCGENSQIVLHASAGYNYTWYLDETLIPGSTTDSLIVTVAGVYSAIATDANGCMATATNKPVIIKIMPPQAAFNFDSYCAEKTINFSNSSVVNESGAVTYAWTTSDEQSSSSLSPQFTFNTAGNYTIQLQVTAQLCPLLHDTLTQTINVQAPVSSVRLNTVYTPSGTPIVLQARDITDATYHWLPATGLSDAGIRTPEATLQNDQTYTISIKQPSGCTTADTLLVSVTTEGDILVPTVFTPNGDGLNDELRPFLKSMKSLQYFRVFDRWGTLVFETKDATQGWNGIFKGKPQTISSYIWLAEGVGINGKSVKKQGAVTLIR